MGCDIHSAVEIRIGGKGWKLVKKRIFPEYGKKISKPFSWRSYGMFGFLAGVRNYSDVPPLSEPRGLPEDISDGTRVLYEGWEGDSHSASWFSLKELLDFNYDQEVEDRRITVQITPTLSDGGATAKPGGGRKTTYREFLGGGFFEHLEILRTLGKPEDVRIVFWFDN